MEETHNVLSWQVTCICGRELVIATRDVGTPVVCKNCHRVLIPVLVRPARSNEPIGGAVLQSPENASAGSEQTTAAAQQRRDCDESVHQASVGNGDGQISGNAQPMNQTDSDLAQKVEFVYQVSTSQWDNFFKYLVCLIIAAMATGVYLVPMLRPYANIVFGSVLIVDFIVVFYIYIGTRSLRCLVGPDRVELHTGVFTRQIDWISLSSIQDMQLRQGFTQRALNIGTIIIKSRDEATPLLKLYQIPKARKIFVYIQEQVSRLRRLPQ